MAWLASNLGPDRLIDHKHISEHINHITNKDPIHLSGKRIHVQLLKIQYAHFFFNKVVSGVSKTEPMTFYEWPLLCSKINLFK